MVWDWNRPEGWLCSADCLEETQAVFAPAVSSADPGSYCVLVSSGHRLRSVSLNAAASASTRSM